MQQLEQLKCSHSLKLEEGMPVIWPHQEQPGHLKVSKIIGTITEQKAYAFTPKVIAFTSDGALYVTPYTKERLEIVRNSGYKLREFFVPFSRGDKPQGEYEQIWLDLVAAKTIPLHQATDTQIRRSPIAATATA